MESQDHIDATKGDAHREADTDACPKGFESSLASIPTADLLCWVTACLWHPSHGPVPSSDCSWVKQHQLPPLCI